LAVIERENARRCAVGRRRAYIELCGGHSPTH
jgi:hypothetical protein